MINVRLVTLPKGTFVKFKTHDSHFFVCYPDPKPMYVVRSSFVWPYTSPLRFSIGFSFETVLRNFAALSQGDHIDIAFDSITYHFEVQDANCLVSFLPTFNLTGFGNKACQCHRYQQCGYRSGISKNNDQRRARERSCTT